MKLANKITEVVDMIPGLVMTKEEIDSLKWKVAAKYSCAARTARDLVMIALARYEELLKEASNAHKKV